MNMLSIGQESSEWSSEYHTEKRSDVVPGNSQGPINDDYLINCINEVPLNTNDGNWTKAVTVRGSKKSNSDKSQVLNSSFSSQIQRARATSLKQVRPKMQ